MAWRPEPKCHFVTTAYEDPSVVVRGDKVEVVKMAGERFASIRVGGKEVDWKSFTLSQRIPGDPCRLVVEVLVK